MLQTKSHIIQSINLILSNYDNVSHAKNNFRFKITTTHNYLTINKLHKQPIKTLSQNSLLNNLKPFAQYKNYKFLFNQIFNDILATKFQLFSLYYQ